MIEHLQLDPAEMGRNEEIMREGNLALKANFDLVKATVGGRYSRRAFRQELFDAMKKTGPLVVRGVVIHSIEKIQAVKDIETVMVKTFTKLVYARAKYYSHKDHGTYLEKDDFLSYGFVGLLEAIYHYTKEVVTRTGKTKIVKFVTYAHWCICRHIRNAIIRKKYNFPWTMQMRRLYERYETARQQANGPSNFQELVDSLGFTVEEQNMLLVSMTSFQSERTISRPGVGSDDNFDDSKGFDYTALAASNAHFHKPESLETDEREFLNKLWVSYLEAEIVEAFTSGHYGWKEEVARKYGITRQAPFETLRRFRMRLEAHNICKRFEAAYASGKKPYAYDYLGEPPEGNKEKLAWWVKIKDALSEIKNRWEGKVA